MVKRLPKYPDQRLDIGADHSHMKGKPREYFDTVDWPGRFPQRWRRLVSRNGGDEAKTRAMLADMSYGLHGEVPEAQEVWSPTDEDRARYKTTMQGCLAAFGWDERKFRRGEYRRGSTKRMAHCHWRGFQHVAGLG